MTHVFRLIATSGVTTRLIEEYIPALLDKQFKITNPKEMFAFHDIEIDTIADLLKLMETVHNKIVIFPGLAPFDEHPFLEIYDDWRE